MRIAVFGSADNNIDPWQKELCEEVGEYLAKCGATVVTGGSAGLPGIVTKSAFEAGANTEVYSPDSDEKEHDSRFDNMPIKYFKKHHFISGFTARSLEMIKNIDGALVVGGRIGTLSEFTIALEEGVDVAVLKGSGGIADHLEDIIKIAKKEFPRKVIFEKDYKNAIDGLIEIMKDEY